MHTNWLCVFVLIASVKESDELDVTWTELSDWWQNSPCPEVKGGVETWHFGHYNYSRSTSHFLCLLTHVGPRAMRNSIARNWFNYFTTCNQGLSCCSCFAFSVLLQCVTYKSRRLLSLFWFCFYWMCEFQVSRAFDVNSSLQKRLDTMVVFYDIGAKA